MINNPDSKAKEQEQLKRVGLSERQIQLIDQVKVEMQTQLKKHVRFYQSQVKRKKLELTNLRQELEQLKGAQSAAYHRNDGLTLAALTIVEKNNEIKQKRAQLQYLRKQGKNSQKALSDPLSAEYKNKFIDQLAYQIKGELNEKIQLLYANEAKILNKVAQDYGALAGPFNEGDIHYDQELLEDCFKKYENETLNNLRLVRDLYLEEYSKLSQTCLYGGLFVQDLQRSVQNSAYQRRSGITFNNRLEEYGYQIDNAAYGLKKLSTVHRTYVQEIAQGRNAVFNEVVKGVQKNSQTVAKGLASQPVNQPVLMSMKKDEAKKKKFIPFKFSELLKLDFWRQVNKTWVNNFKKAFAEKEIDLTQTVDTINQEIDQLTQEYQQALHSGKEEKIIPVTQDLARRKVQLQSLQRSTFDPKLEEKIKHGLLAIDSAFALREKTEISKPPKRKKPIMTFYLKRGHKSQADKVEANKAKVNETDQLIDRKWLDEQFETAVTLANQTFGEVLKNVKFASAVKETRESNPTKYQGRASLAEQAECKVGTFIAQAYIYPSLANTRDQLVIDSMETFNKQHARNPSDPEGQVLTIMSDIIAGMNNLRSYEDKIIQTKEQLQNDPETLADVLKNMKSLYYSQAVVVAQRMQTFPDERMQLQAQALLSQLPSSYQQQAAQEQKKSPFIRSRQ